MRLLVAAPAVIAMPAWALAQEAAPAGSMANSPLASMLPLLVIFAVFYFLLIKPQQKRFKEHAALLGALKKGDAVVTSGGIVGKVVDADKDGITTVEIAPGVNVQVTKSSIASLVADKTTTTPKKKTKSDGLVKNDNVVLKKDQIANDN